MTTLEEFIVAIKANPDDNTPRLVFADWLDEQGTPAHTHWAELIRVQCELSTIRRFENDDATFNRRAALSKREKTMVGDRQKGLGTIVDGHVFQFEFRCGFIEEVQGTAAGLIACGPSFCRGNPIRRMVVNNPIHHGNTLEYFDGRYIVENLVVLGPSQTRSMEPIDTAISRMILEYCNAVADGTHPAGEPYPAGTLRGTRFERTIDSIGREIFRSPGFHDLLYGEPMIVPPAGIINRGTT